MFITSGNCSYIKVALHVQTHPHTHNQKYCTAANTSANQRGVRSTEQSLWSISLSYRTLIFPYKTSCVCNDTIWLMCCLGDNVHTSICTYIGSMCARVTHTWLFPPLVVQKVPRGHHWWPLSPWTRSLSSSLRHWCCWRKHIFSSYITTFQYSHYHQYLISCNTQHT